MKKAFRRRRSSLKWRLRTVFRRAESRGYCASECSVGNRPRRHISRQQASCKTNQGGRLHFDAQIELHNRFLHIDYPYGSQAAEIIAPLHRTKRKRSEKSGQKKAVRNASPKTVDRLWLLLKENPRLSQAEMVEVLGVTRSTIQKHLDNLKKAGRLRRVGPDKGGRWEVVSG